MTFFEAAKEAINYENTAFNPQEGNWLDYISNKNIGNSLFHVAWCHGAAGIGLERLGSLHILDSKKIRYDIDTALKSTISYSMESVDQICCGNFGRIEFLLGAYLKFSNDEFYKEAQKRASWAIARSKQIGSYKLFENIPEDLYSPVFFRGVAGIGYELLRLAKPNLIPSVLLLQ